MSTGTTWWWLSFCDPAKPTGEKFLGAVALEVPAGVHFLTHSHEMKLNPGGEVVFCQIDPVDLEANVPLDKRNRLLSRQEAESI